MRHLTWLHLGTYNGLNFQFLGFKQISSLSRVELDVFLYFVDVISVQIDRYIQNSRFYFNNNNMTSVAS